MNTHSIDLNGYLAQSRGRSTIYLGTAGSHGNEQLQVTLGNGWEGLTVQVVFHPSKVAVQLPSDGVLDVPWEATAQPLTMMQGRIVFQGFNGDRLMNTTDLAYTVADHSPALGRDEEPYTPGIVEGVLNQMAADKDAILQAAQQTGQAREAAAASAAEAAVSAANAQQSAGAAGTSAGQAAVSAAAAGEVLSQVQKAGQNVKDAETEALHKISAAAPALPAVSADAAWQSVTVKADGTGYGLASLAPIEATIRPTASGNPAVCSDSIAWGLQGLKLYGKSTQDGTPSPDNPVPIVSAGDDGSVRVSVRTNQLLDDTDGTKTLYQLPEPLKPGTYTVSFDSDSTRGGFRLSKTTDTSVDSVVSTNAMSAGNGRLYLTVTTSFEANYINVSSNDSTYVKNIMLHSGGSPLPFEPYSLQSLTFSTPSGLAGIPVDSGGNYTDVEGQQWVCDSIDYGAGKYLQRCKKFVFDGSADEGWELLTDGNEGRFRYVSRYSIGIADSTKTSNRSLNSNFAIGAQGSTVNTDDVYTIVAGGAIYVSTNGSDSLETFQSYLASNPMTLIGVLPTPIETDIPAEELAACRAVTTYDETTVVSIPENVSGLEVQYVTDGTKYAEKVQSMESRLAALEAAQLKEVTKP